MFIKLFSEPDTSLKGAIKSKALKLWVEQPFQLKFKFKSQDVPRQTNVVDMCDFQVHTHITKATTTRFFSFYLFFSFFFFQPFANCSDVKKPPGEILTDLEFLWVSNACSTVLLSSRGIIKKWYMFLR